jgi:predicted nucleic-acid-binding protein
MGAADTNVLLRLLVRDNARQTSAADAFVAHGVWVSILALAETVWVLDSVYGRTPAALAEAIEMLLNHRSLTVQDADAVSAALDLFRSRPTPGFSDCLMLQLARKAGNPPLGTFDRSLGKVEGARKL